WMNGVYLRQMPLDRLAQEAAARLEAAGYTKPEEREAVLPRLETILKEVQTRIKRLDELVPWTYYYFTDDIQYDPAAVEKFLKQEAIPEIFAEAADGLEALEPFTLEGIEAVFEGIRERRGMKLGAVLQPVGAVLTGSRSHDTLLGVGGVPSDPVGEWCNGNTLDSGSSNEGSNPSSPAKAGGCSTGFLLSPPRPKRERAPAIVAGALRNDWYPHR